MSAIPALVREPYDVSDAKAFLNLAIQAACDAGASEAIIEQLMDALRYLETLPHPPADDDWLDLD